MTGPFADDLSKEAQLARSPGRENICSAEDCERVVGPHGARGFCDKHYQRWERYGSADLPPRPSRWDRFWSRVDALGDCWEWTGVRRRSGYGQFGRAATAHREAWMMLVGPIPAGLELDHLCRNRGCVNPDHLEPVTRAINLARGAPPGRKPQTHCYKGHDLNLPTNRIDRNGYRVCRECFNEARRERRRRAR